MNIDSLYRIQIHFIHENKLYLWSIAENVETRFDTSNYELDRPLPKEIKKEVIRVMKDGLGGKFMTKFVWLRAKTYSYLIDDGSEDKKKQKTQKVRHKKIQLENKINHLKKIKLT